MSTAASRSAVAVVSQLHLDVIRPRMAKGIGNCLPADPVDLVENQRVKGPPLAFRDYTEFHSPAAAIGIGLIKKVGPVPALLLAVETFVGS